VTAPQADPLDYRDLLAKLDREQERVRDENEWVRIDVEVEAFASRAERELREHFGGQIPVNAVRSVLPANADPLVPQDPSRRAHFAQHLAEITEAAILDEARLPSDPVDVEPRTNGRDSLSAGVCAACRGSCCRAGGDQAYLTEETMVRSLRAHPDWTLAQLMDAYLKHLPAETVLNSCIYHSAKGCGLPRDLRSSTCNRYLCGKLKNLLAGLPENSPPPILAVMFDDGKWTRTALIDEAGSRVLAEEAAESDDSSGAGGSRRSAFRSIATAAEST
jgi:hypothetical protein